jgi:hypothetical protein
MIGASSFDPSFAPNFQRLIHEHRRMEIAAMLGDVIGL